MGTRRRTIWARESEENICHSWMLAVFCFFTRLFVWSCNALDIRHLLVLLLNLCIQSYGRERERKRERKSVCVCVSEREREGCKFKIIRQGKIEMP